MGASAGGVEATPAMLRNLTGSLTTSIFIKQIAAMALWTALKTLEETARPAKRLADTERSRGHQWMVKPFQEKEHDARRKAELIRRLIESSDAEVPSEAARIDTAPRV